MAFQYTGMETIHLHIIFHRGVDRIACKIPYASSVNHALKNITGIRWSRTKKQWHLPLSPESVKEIVRYTNGIAYVNIDMLREELLLRKKSPAKDDPLVTAPFVAAFTELVHPVKDALISDENKESLRLYLQMLIIKAYSPKTIKTYRNEFTRFLVKLMHISASSLNPLHIKRYMEYCATEEK